MTTKRKQVAGNPMGYLQIRKVPLRILAKLRAAATISGKTVPVFLIDLIDKHITETGGK